jgi:hypothetical protein
VTTLYPRLLSVHAEDLYARQRKIFTSTGNDPLQLTSQVEVHPASIVYTATGGRRATDDELCLLREKVLVLAKQAGFPYPVKDISKNFDPAAARLLHEQIEMLPVEAAALDIWAYMSLCLLPDVSWWRFPKAESARGENGKANQERFLAADLTRHVFGRLWWRAQLVHLRDDPEPYWGLSVLNETEFDQIQARREQMGASPRLVRDLITVWEEAKRLGTLADFEERTVLRSCLQRIMRLFPFTDFDTITSQQRRDLVRKTLDETLYVSVRKSARSASPETSCRSQSQ